GTQSGAPPIGPLRYRGRAVPMDLLRSLPIGLYLEQPSTWLHRVDGRVKFAWLLSFLLTPIAAGPAWRLTIVVVLLVLTLISGIPRRVWQRQVALLLAFSLLLFAVTLLLPDGVEVGYQPRLPLGDVVTFADEPANAAVDLPQPSGYRYILVDRGFIYITRRSLDLAIRISTLTFTLLYSSTLYLLTTAPEEITAGLEFLMRPLRVLRVPVTEIVLTLTLSLRFIPLVLEEVQNLVRSVRTRAINWKKLGIRGSIQVWLMVAERLFQNLILRAEQTAGAMQARGFTTAATHRVRWHQFRFRARDAVAIAILIGFWFTRLRWG
ncbi:MAG: energy-coupling factor transporter transmembrane protein EcfT, partial [Elainellaceae cyanobacterium]